MVSPLGDLGYTWPFLAAVVLGYLLGSVPFGVLLTRAAGLGDIRRVGSGNIGATNVLRTGRKGLALATLLLDGGKGAAAVLLAGQFGQDIAVLAGGGAFLGHLFPPWLRFRGGKGVATFLGVLLALVPLAGLLACSTWLLAAVFARYSSLAALAAAVAAPVYVWWLGDWQRMELTIAMAVLVFIRHRLNIRRLISGDETKISLGRGSKAGR
ncbi:MAG: glycerol-3-phosphate 1-O-acyltransferase PlsY [Alphaproteobacteria bacterium]|nr:glycerol-3-phosphate 1-O-acyltransferase PlsY [Alphaproteobacteria bacterium]